MEFKIEELGKKKSAFVVDLSKKTLKEIKEKAKKDDIFELDFESLNLGEKLYSTTKKDSILIQKRNCKIVLNFYKYCKKLINIIKRKNIGFDGTFYVKGLDQKKNNNDFMLSALLDTRYNAKPFGKLSKTINHACDYLDMENDFNNMCDFKDNLCVSHRERGLAGITGCCPAFCKHTKAGRCQIKNLACKIFMCNYLEERGYFFSVHAIPIMKLHMNFIERFCVAGLLFKTTKKTIAYSWIIRSILLAYVAVFLFVIGCVIV